MSDPSFSIIEETSLASRMKDIIDEATYIDYILSRQESVVQALTRSQPKSRILRTVAEMVQERHESWSSVGATATAALAEIQAQMDLKQKQANLSESRMSRFQAQTSASHSRIMLLFTVVTIIFLPLSFLASWFGMNIQDPKAGGLKLYQIAAIIFSISLVIAVMALSFAFNERLRGFVIGVGDSCCPAFSGLGRGGHVGNYDDGMEMV